MKTLKRFTLVFGITALAWPAAAEISVKSVEMAPPDAVSEAIAATLESKAIQVMDGDEALYDFWFVKELSLKAKPESADKALDQVREMSLLGVAVSHVEQYDYRDDEVLENTYIMRYALQPSDGNHLGTADFDSFALFLPAEIDTEVEQWDDRDDMVEASAGETAAEHPIILLMRPVESADEDPSLESPVEEEQGVRIKIDGKAADATVPVPFTLIFEGHGEL